MHNKSKQTKWYNPYTYHIQDKILEFVDEKKNENAYLNLKKELERTS